MAGKDRCMHDPLPVRLVFGTNNEHYTEEAIALSNKANELLSPLIRECKEKGLSIRDVEYIITIEVQQICLQHIQVI